MIAIKILNCSMDRWIDFAALFAQPREINDKVHRYRSYSRLSEDKRYLLPLPQNIDPRSGGRPISVLSRDVIADRCERIIGARITKIMFARGTGRSAGNNAIERVASRPPRIFREFVVAEIPFREASNTVSG